MESAHEHHSGDAASRTAGAERGRGNHARRPPSRPVIRDAGEPRVRIQLPPAESLQTLGPSRKLMRIEVERGLPHLDKAVGPREILWGGRRGNGNFVAVSNRWSAAMPQPNDLSRSLVALDQNSTIIAVVELSQSSWLVGGVLPGIERQPCKKLEPSPG